MSIIVHVTPFLLVPDLDAALDFFTLMYDVDALYVALQPRLATLPADDVQAPADQDWNQRELSVRMPDGHWLTFGHPIQRYG